MTDRKRVLVLCTGNSARSQMAEGFLRHMAPARFEVTSAGVSPTQIRSEAIQVMAEIGIDISGQYAKSVESVTGQSFDYVITVCDNANEHCPHFSEATQRIHWSFEDPAAIQGDEEATLSAFRHAREEIRNQLQLFVADVTKGATDSL